MKCTRCGFDNPPGFAWCGKCGNALTQVCPRCGFEVAPGLAFCGRCGATLAAAPKRLTPDDPAVPPLSYLYLPLVAR